MIQKSRICARMGACGFAFVAVLALALVLAPAALRAAEPRKATAEAVAALAQNPTVPAAGAKDADVTIVEFFDYNCPFCKKTAPELQKLLHTDPKVRILYKEWPIFGDVSDYAARSALAANWQGKFLVAHEALIGAPNDLDETSQVDAVLKTAGVDLPQLIRDRSAHAAEITAILARNSKEAASLGFRGTPGFVVGRQLVPLALTLQSLQQLTQSARQSP
jgi:protein-disulfide isomerase